MEEAEKEITDFVRLIHPALDSHFGYTLILKEFHKDRDLQASCMRAQVVLKERIKKMKKGIFYLGEPIFEMEYVE